MKKLITGFCVETGRIQDMEKKLFEIREMARERAHKAYSELLTDEITFLVDSVALSLVNRPNASILCTAETELMDRVMKSSFKAYGTKYDFNASVHIFYFEGKTYVRLNARNDIYSKYIAKIDGVLPFNLTSSDYEAKDNENARVWTGLMKKHESAPPVGMQLINPEDLFHPDQNVIKKFRYDTPARRAKVMARRQMTSSFMQRFACEAQIPQFRTMKFIDDALLAVVDKSQNDELLEREKELSGILPVIDYDLITREPGVAPQTL